MIEKVLNLPISIKLFIAIVIDIFIAIISVWFAYYLRLGEFLSLFEIQSGHIPANALLGSILILLPIFILLDQYKTLYRFSNFYPC